MSRLILKKGGPTPVLASHKKRIFRLKRAFLCRSQRPVRRLSRQISSFRSETYFFFFLTNVHLTVMLHYRIQGFLRTELLVRNSFQSEVFHLRERQWKHRVSRIFERRLLPLLPPLTTPLFLVHLLAWGLWIYLK